MTTATRAATRLDVLEALRVCAALYAVRGYFQPLSRQWEPQPPTEMEARQYLTGDRYPTLRREVDGVSDAAATAATVLEWCRAGRAEDSAYRRKLAAVTATATTAPGNLAVLASAPAVWAKEQAAQAAARAAAESAARSRHLGTQGERLTKLTVTVVTVLSLGQRRYGYHTQPQS
ncbi:hypothetical protein ACFVXQ_28935, partial [Kitasatospora sp. NPDC058263]